MGNANGDESRVGQMATDMILEMAARMNPLHELDPYEEASIEQLYADLPVHQTVLYVDTTILKDIRQVQRAISQTLEQWPEEKPPIHFISVYARPSKVTAWKTHLDGTHTELHREVAEIDKPSQNPTMQITADAIHHLLIHRVAHVAVICDKLAIGTLFSRIVQVGRTTTISVIAAVPPVTNEPISLSPMKGVGINRTP